MLNFTGFPYIVLGGNGSVVPSGMPIEYLNGVYRLTGNISDYSIAVETDNAVIDGAGFTLQGSILYPGQVNSQSLGAVGLMDVDNVTVENLNILTFDEGIWNLGSSDVTIANNSISGCEWGIAVISNQFYDNTTKNFSYAAAMNNNVTNNRITDNQVGINVLGATYSSNIAGNIISNNEDGICFEYGNNTVKSNTISENTIGILNGAGTDNNVFFANNLTQNDQAVILSGAKNNLFYCNDFIKNNQSAGLPKGILSNMWPNNWDNGSVGNYWSDYPKTNPNATEIDDSGIANQPYTVAINNIDNFPLAEPYNRFYSLATTPPTITLLSPNQPIKNSTVPLTFSADKTINWAGYSLDGKQNTTLLNNNTAATGTLINLTLSNMTAGLHTIKVYSNDTFGNMGASEKVTFQVTQQPRSPIVTAIVISGTVAIAIVSVGLFFHFKRRKVLI